MIFHKQSALQEVLSSHRSQNKSIGLVPTMGALHKGHLSLVQTANTQNDLVVVSIFVNPTQFDNASDLAKYPRTLYEDVKLLAALDKNVMVYAPSPDDLYGENIRAKKYNFGTLETEMEGKFRDGHFDGVGTVVNLLLRAVQPDKAYFGEKDFQQLQIIRKLVEIENIPVQIVGCEIERASNGLAMSSRNQRLTDRQKNAATLIYQSLQYVSKHFSEKSIPNIKKKVAQMFQQNQDLKLEYFEIANIENLKPAKRKRKQATYRAFIAAYAGEVRLIDNMALN